MSLSYGYLSVGQTEQALSNIKQGSFQQEDVTAVAVIWLHWS